MAALLTVLAILALYIPVKLPLPDVNLFLPNIFYLALVGVSVFYLRDSFIHFANVAGVFVVFIIVNLLFTDKDATSLIEKMRSSALLAFNIFAFLLLSRSSVVRQLERLWQGISIGLFCWAVGVYAFLETKVGAFQQISDAFRNYVFQGGFVYAADLRDIALIGAVRAKVFTSEPSHAAFAACSLGLLYVVLNPVPRRFLAATAIYALIAAFVGSPFPLLFLIALGLVYLIARPRELKVGTLVLIGFIVLMLVTLFVVMSGGYMQNRLLETLAGREGSASVRILYQVLFAQEALSKNMLLGVGLGGEKELGDLLFALKDFQGLDTNIVIQSPLLSVITFGGLLGGALFFWLMWFSIRLSGWRKWLGLLLIAVLFFQSGGISNSLSWVIAGMLLSVINHRIHSSLNEPREPSRVILPSGGIGTASAIGVGHKFNRE